MATAMAAEWTDWAVMEPSSPQFDKHGKPVKWRVQRNAEGAWRCYCKGYIFSGKGGAVRTCKHIRHCQALLAVETAQTPKAVVAAPVNRWAAEATKTTAAMLQAASMFANEQQTAKMVEVLTAKLKAWGPAPAPVTVVAQTAVVTIGVRHITFDD